MNDEVAVPAELDPPDGTERVRGAERRATASSSAPAAPTQRASPRSCSTCSTAARTARPSGSNARRPARRRRLAQRAVTPTVAPAVMRSPSGRDQLVSARSSASIGTPTAPTSSAARRCSSSGSPMPSTRLEATTVGSSASAAELQRPGPHLVDAEAPEDHQQLEARGAAEARQRQALEGAVEAALVGPCRVAGEGLRLRAGALGPRAVGEQGRGPARRVVRGARPERDVLEHRQLAGGPGRARQRRSTPTGPRPRAATR